MLYVYYAIRIACVQALVLVKRETGANPVRTRHRNQGAEADMSLDGKEKFIREDGGCVGLFTNLDL